MISQNQEDQMDLLRTANMDNPITAYAYNDTIEAIRETEYPMLQDSIYLDHAGATLCSKSLMDGFAAEMTSVLYGNPHSASWPSQQSTARIENIRLRLLHFFKADPNEFDLIFVANATAGVKLVVEGMRSLPRGFSYAHHQACHTSLIGVREEANHSVCLDDAAMDAWSKGEDPFAGSKEISSPILVSYSAQSHMNGKRYPLLWSSSLRSTYHPLSPRVYTLLDAASLAATSPLDLSDPENAPDFTVLSLYKIFGFPDLGALIVRRSAGSVFDHRKYFGGGTVDMVVCGKEQWHAPKSQFLHERLEDGTLPFHNIMALDVAMNVHEQLFGSIQHVQKHTSLLTTELLRGLRSLRHGNEQPVCILYTDDTVLSNGPVVAFNIKNSAGAWISLAEFEKLAALKKMHVRTGGVCSPGGISSALDLEPWEVKRNFSAGFRCGNDNDIIAGKPTGIIRASFGAMSTRSDVTKFLDFIQEFFVETEPPLVPLSTAPADNTQGIQLKVKSITLYPIKSCGGMAVPEGSGWEVRPEGLAWDREWCLVHRGSGQALSQKRYPKMALLRPFVDFSNGVLRVDYLGHSVSGGETYITVPLSLNPALFEKGHRQRPSRVCGDEVSPYIYSCPEINSFFSSILGVPCMLSRLPPGGQGQKSRVSKARMQTHQRRHSPQQLPGTFPDIPSPPESDSEQQRQSKILLSNESPILMVHAASIDALNAEILSRNGTSIEDSAFRANIVVQSAIKGESLTPFSEDTWSNVRIGLHRFKLLGACQRCQMVCVNQATGEKGQEPYVTLAKMRRFDGKVYFGSHMRHHPEVERNSEESQCPMIQVGDPVLVDEAQ